MPRIPRQQYLQPNGYYHIISRSINQMKIFQHPVDFEQFRILAHEAKKRFPLRLFHYVFMSTHFHLVVQIIDPTDLSAHLGYLKWQYTQWMKTRYGWKGPLWRERYRSLPIENEEYLAACGAYVEFNPVRAGLCNSPVDYPFSSSKKYHLGTPDTLLDDYNVREISTPLLTIIHEPNTADAFFTRSPAIGNPAFIFGHSKPICLSLSVPGTDGDRH